MHAKRVVQTAYCLGKSKKIEGRFWKTKYNFGKLRKVIPNARKCRIQTACDVRKSKAKYGKVRKSKEKYGKVGKIRKSKESYSKCALSAGSKKPIWWGEIKEKSRKVRKSKESYTKCPSNTGPDCLREIYKN